MTDIPQDIKLAAQLALDGVTTFPDETYTDDAYNIIASAILAERLRCAEIALGWAEDEYQAGETKLASAYIWREIIRGVHV